MALELFRGPWIYICTPGNSTQYFLRRQDARCELFQEVHIMLTSSDFSLFSCFFLILLANIFEYTFQVRSQLVGIRCCHSLESWAKEQGVTSVTDKGSRTVLIRDAPDVIRHNPPINFIKKSASTTSEQSDRLDKCPRAQRASAVR